MVQLTDEYKAKVVSCRKAIRLLGADLSALIRVYQGSFFPDGGPSKAKVFSEVLEGQLSKETYEFMQKVCSLVHFRDSRDAYEYGVDLVLGWLVEDAVLLVLREKGKKAILSGQDRFREFLHPRKISTQPDISVKFNCGERLLEVFADWKGTWNKKNHADLRDNKYGKLKEHGAVMFGISPTTEQGFVIDFAKPDDFQPGFIAAYRKTGYTYKGIRDILVPLEDAIRSLLDL